MMIQVCDNKSMPHSFCIGEPMNPNNMLSDGVFRNQNQLEHLAILIHSIK